MKKLMYSAGAFALSALPVLAEETSGSGTSDGSLAEGVLADAQGALEGILTSAGPVVSAVIVAGLGLWGAIAIVGVVKRAFNSGKGR